MKNIFVDGDIVATIPIPSSLQNSVYKKYKWAKSILESHVRARFGQKIHFYFKPSRSSKGKVTGTMAEVTRSDKIITFFITEVKAGDEIHISEMSENLNEGDVFDLINYKCSGEGQMGQQSINSPFAAALAQIDKTTLPKKVDTVKLKVIRNPKKLNGLQFACHYLKNDPYVEGCSSMRVFHLAKKAKLKEGQELVAKILQVFPSEKKSKKGAKIVNINVAVI